MPQYKARTYFVVLAVLLVVLGMVGVVSANNYTYKLYDIGPGMKVNGTYDDGSGAFWAGIIKIHRTDNTDMKYKTFCTDLGHTTRVGTLYQINTNSNTDIAMECPILYLLNKYPPVGGLTQTEAAARQAALWYFSDGFVPTDPPGVVSRYAQIVDEVNNITYDGLDPHLACQVIQTTTPMMRIETVTGSTDQYNVVVTIDGSPVAGLAVTVKVDGQVLLADEPTDSEGKVFFFAPGATKIEAEASYAITTPLGVTLISESDPTKQRLVMPDEVGGFIPLFAEYEVVTAITLASFEVEVKDNGQVVVMWETGTELDNAGFNLYRAMAADGPWVKINDAMLAATGDPVAGANYTFVDTPGRGRFYYRLEDVNFNGLSTRHDPAVAELGPSIRIPWFRPSLPF